MVDKLPTLKSLISNIHRIPYLASRNVYRVATHFLDMDDAQLEQFCAVLLQAKKRLVKCSVCYAWCEQGQGCQFCDESSRNKQLVCVVETWHDLVSIEKSGGYRGVYHVLGGAICPLEGVGPDDLSIEALIKRVPDIAEIVLATNQTTEGEATRAYIAHKLRGASVKLTCLAQGVPMGSSLEFMDRVTVGKALLERKSF